MDDRNCQPGNERADAGPAAPFNVVLVEPQIPPNTGNIARLCAATGATLHLVHPLGFKLTDRYLRRAGLDCWTAVRLVEWRRLEDVETAAARAGAAWHPFSTRGRIPYQRVAYRPGDFLVLGPETGGLEEQYLERHAGRVVRIPMPGGGVRSLNLATAAGIILSEALRQTGGLQERPG